MQLNELQWEIFLKGIHAVFPAALYYIERKYKKEEEEIE
jgi:hypothetical protein